MSSISGSDELFGTAIDLFYADLEAYTETGISIIKALLTAMQRENQRAKFAKSTQEENDIVEGSLVKKLISILSGSDLVAMALPEEKMLTFAKYLKTHGETAYVAIENYKSANDCTESYIIVFARGDLSTVRSAITSCGQSIVTKNTVLIPQRLLELIKNQYQLYTNESIKQIEREKAISDKPNINKAIEVSGATEALQKTPLEIERILNYSSDVMSEIKEASTNEPVKVHGQDFIHRLVEVAQMSGSVTKQDLKLLPKNMIGENQKKVSLLLTGKRLEISFIEFEHKDNPFLLPTLGNRKVTFDYLLDSSLFPTEVLDKCEMFGTSTKYYIGLNDGDIEKFYKSVNSCKTSPDTSAVFRSVSYGDTYKFCHSYSLCQMLKEPETARKTYQERFKVARENYEKLHTLTGKEQKEFAKKSLGTYDRNNMSFGG